MDKNQFHRDLQYLVAMNLFRQLSESGLITVEEYNRLDGIMAEKYSSLISTLREKNA